jgi:hypothetical protein
LDVTRFRATSVGGLDAPSEPSADEAARWNGVAEAVVSEPRLWKWPDSWFGIPLSDVLAPRIQYFVSRIVPDLVREADLLRRLCAAEEIDVAVMPHIADVSQAATILASRSTRTLSLHIEHGDGIFDAGMWDFADLLLVDHYVTTNEERAAYQRRRGERYGRPVARVHTGSYRWRELAGKALTRKSRLRRRIRQSVRRRRLVVYVLTNTTGDARYLNIASFPDDWYYAFLTEVADWFATRKDLDVVFKLFPGDGHAYNPIRDYIDDLAVPHLSTSTAPLSRWIPRADRVIVDFPSTALYESALAGVPFLGLVWAGHKIREAAREVFGSRLATFRTASEALREIAAFLADDVSREQVLRPEGSDLLALTEKLAPKE